MAFFIQTHDNAEERKTARFWNLDHARLVVIVGAGESLRVRIFWMNKETDELEGQEAESFLAQVTGRIQEQSPTSRPAAAAQVTGPTPEQPPPSRPGPGTPVAGRTQEKPPPSRPAPTTTPPGRGLSK